MPGLRFPDKHPEWLFHVTLWLGAPVHACTYSDRQLSAQRAVTAARESRRASGGPRRGGSWGQIPEAESRCCSESVLVSALTWGKLEQALPPVYLSHKNTPGNVKQVEGSR